MNTDSIEKIDSIEIDSTDRKKYVYADTKIRLFAVQKS
jgi:hypothetical protein